MEYNLTAYSIYEIGKRTDAAGNPHQEDYIFPSCSEISCNSKVFILCDGMGGHDAGEIASSVVCESLGKSISSMLNANPIFSMAELKQALSIAYDALDANDTGSTKKMGTTLAMVVFHNNGVMVAHIGDSRIYHIRTGNSENETSILFQTEDHSLLNSLVKAGEISFEEAKQSVKKNIITRAMQPNADRPEADVTEIRDVQQGDWFYICSDGMLEQEEMEDGSAIKRIFSNQVNDDEKVRILKDATSENQDNHSAIVIKVISVVDGFEKKPNYNKQKPRVWDKIKALFK